MNVALHVVAANKEGDDRAGALPRPRGHLFVLADGAGGITGGSTAADAVLASVHGCSLSSPADCVHLLRDLDRRLEDVGLTTAVLVVVEDGLVFGASVGDSNAWLVTSSSITDLTEYQKLKPLLGSGKAAPIGFGPIPCVGRLVVGSDGLFKYVSFERIRDLATTLPVAEVPAALVAAARLGSGVLRDDIAVIVAG